MQFPPDLLTFTKETLMTTLIFSAAFSDKDNFIPQIRAARKSAHI